MEVNGLIATLLANDPQLAGMAEGRLVAMGDFAEPQLVELYDREGLVAMARQRIEGILARIKNGRAVSPQLLSLKYQGAKPQEIYADLAVQSKMHFSASTEKLLCALKQPAMDFEVDKLTPLQALLKLNSACNLYFESIDAARQITLNAMDAKLAAAPVATAGPVLTAVKRIEVNVGHSIDFAGPKTVQARNNGTSDAICRIYCYTWCDPGMKPLAWFVDSVDVCVTDMGNYLTPARSVFGNAITGGINSNNASELVLRGPIDRSTRITHLAMTTTFLFERDRRKLDIPNVLTTHDTTYQLGDVRVVFKGIGKREEGRYFADMSIFRGTRDANDWDHMKMLYGQGRDCKLLDADGNSYKAGARATNYGQDGIILRTEFSDETDTDKKPGPPFRILWSGPAAIERITLPMEFKDIPLPG